MPNSEFKDLGYNFKIECVDSIPTELRDEFKKELSQTDQELIDYFFNLKLNNKLEYLISIEIILLDIAQFKLMKLIGIYMKYTLENNIEN